MRIEILVACRSSFSAATATGFGRIVETSHAPIMLLGLRQLDIVLVIVKVLQREQRRSRLETSHRVAKSFVILLLLLIVMTHTVHEEK